MTSRALSASAVSRQLADAGHERARWTNNHDEWAPGYRVGQVGEQVVVSCEELVSQGRPDAEDGRLAEYALALTNLGYQVETVEREEDTGNTGRHVLIVSRGQP